MSANDEAEEVRRRIKFRAHEEQIAYLDILRAQGILGRRSPNRNVVEAAGYRVIDDDMPTLPAGESNSDEAQDSHP